MNQTIFGYQGGRSVWESMSSAHTRRGKASTTRFSRSSVLALLILMAAPLCANALATARPGSDAPEVSQKMATDNQSARLEKHVIVRRGAEISEATRARFLISQLTEVQTDGALRYSAARFGKLLAPAAPTGNEAGIEEVLRSQDLKIRAFAERTRDEICTRVDGAFESIDLEALAAAIDGLKREEDNLYTDSFTAIAGHLSEVDNRILADSVSQVDIQEFEFDTRQLLSMNPRGAIASIKGRCAADSVENPWGTEIVFGIGGVE